MGRPESMLVSVRMWEDVRVCKLVCSLRISRFCLLLTMIVIRESTVLTYVSFKVRCKSDECAHENIFAAKFH